MYLLRKITLNTHTHAYTNTHRERERERERESLALFQHTPPVSIYGLPTKGMIIEWNSQITSHILCVTHPTHLNTSQHTADT